MVATVQSGAQIQVAEEEEKEEERAGGEKTILINGPFFKIKKL